MLVCQVELPNASQKQGRKGKEETESEGAPPVAKRAKAGAAKVPTFKDCDAV